MEDTGGKAVGGAKQRGGKLCSEPIWVCVDLLSELSVRGLGGSVVTVVPTCQPRLSVATACRAIEVS